MAPTIVVQQRPESDPLRKFFLWSTPVFTCGWMLLAIPVMYTKYIRNQQIKNT